MQETAKQIKIAVEEAVPVLKSMTREEVSSRPSPEKWSRKEMLGHLIDSAANNHQRLVRAAYGAAEQFPGYDQNRWVAIQRHQETEWEDLLQFWTVYNRHLCRLIECLPAEAFSARCGIGKEEPVPLEFVVRDYLRHLRHHLDRLLAR